MWGTSCPIFIINVDPPPPSSSSSMLIIVPHLHPPPSSADPSVPSVWICPFCLFHFCFYFTILISLGCLASFLHESIWFFPIYLLYAIVFAFAEVAANELNHESLSRSKWLNSSAHWLVCFMSWREPVYSKYRHLKHHSHTSVIGQDPEGEAVRPKSIGLMGLEMLTKF